MRGGAGRVALRIDERKHGSAQVCGSILEVTKSVADELVSAIGILGDQRHQFDVGEESGKLDEMLLKVAEIEERQMRARTKTLISFLAPVLILIVGAVVGFMVIALLLPIFKMASAMR